MKGYERRSSWNEGQATYIIYVIKSFGKHDILHFISTNTRSQMLILANLVFDHVNVHYAIKKLGGVVAVTLFLF